MFLGETYAVPFKRYELKNTQHLVLFSPSLVRPNNFTRFGRLLRDNLFPGKLTVSIRDHEIRIFKKMLQNNDWTQSEGLVKITPAWAASADTKTHHLLTGQNESSPVIQCSKHRISHAPG